MSQLLLFCKFFSMKLLCSLSEVLEDPSSLLSEPTEDIFASPKRMLSTILRVALRRLDVSIPNVVWSSECVMSQLLSCKFFSILDCVWLSLRFSLTAGYGIGPNLLLLPCESSFRDFNHLRTLRLVLRIRSVVLLLCRCKLLLRISRSFFVSRVASLIEENGMCHSSWRIDNLFPAGIFISRRSLRGARLCSKALTDIETSRCIFQPMLHHKEIELDD